MIEIKFTCDGCFAETKATVPHPRTEGVFRDLQPGESGFVKTTHPTIRDCAPDGWIVFDPFTRLVYCPACWSLIDQHTAEEEAS